MKKILTPTCVVARIRGVYPQHTLRAIRAADDLIKAWGGATGIILASGVVIAIGRRVSRGSSRFRWRMMEIALTESGGTQGRYKGE